MISMLALAGSCPPPPPRGEAWTALPIALLLPKFPDHRRRRTSGITAMPADGSHVVPSGGSAGWQAPAPTSQDATTSAVWQAGTNFRALWRPASGDAREILFLG
jgi:hypothetical protein